MVGNMKESTIPYILYDNIIILYVGTMLAVVQNINIYCRHLQSFSLMIIHHGTFMVNIIMYVIEFTGH